MDFVLEEIIKTIFGNNWLIPAIMFVVTLTAIRVIVKRSFPRYFKTTFILILALGAVLATAYFLPWSQYSSIFPVVRELKLFVIVLMVILMAVLLFQYIKNDKELRLVIRNTKADGNRIMAWKNLQNIKSTNLMPWQKRKYDKKRLYLRVVLGNLCGAEQELENYKEDKPFYHYMKAIMLNFKGKHKAELEEIKLAEDYCSGDTDAMLRFQILCNRGVAYVGVGEYEMADDCFQKTIAFGKEKEINAPDLWLIIYYNYVFNKTRLDFDLSTQRCLDMLEDVKQYIDIEDPKQYIGYSNVVVDLLRQKNACRENLDEVIHLDFTYLVNTNLSNQERCMLEATTARMICTGRLNPEGVIEKLSEDIDHFLELPMPEKYRCFKEIDYMFKDLRGALTKEHSKIRETAHWYLVNQAIYDLREYRATLPSEAVYEICYCFQEIAGLLKYKQQKYDWDEFLKNMKSAQMLYIENELLADSALCSLNIMDEALSELNVDFDYKSLYSDALREALINVEETLHELMEHPILNEIYLRLSIYCFHMDELEKSKEYYRKFQLMGKFAINHFAPWLRGKYSIISLYMFVVHYIEAVDKISKENMDAEIPQVQDWFKAFHERNGYYEAVVLGRIFGGEVLPLCIKCNDGVQSHGENINYRDINETYLVMPTLHLKIKCNSRLNGRLIGEGCLFSACQNEEIRFCNVNTIMPDMRAAIEHIVLLIRNELPDYLVSDGELNQLAKEHWYDISCES